MGAISWPQRVENASQGLKREDLVKLVANHGSNTRLDSTGP